MLIITETIQSHEPGDHSKIQLKIDWIKLSSVADQLHISFFPIPQNFANYSTEKIKNSAKFKNCSKSSQCLTFHNKKPTPLITRAPPFVMIPHYRHNQINRQRLSYITSKILFRYHSFLSNAMVRQITKNSITPQLTNDDSSLLLCRTIFQNQKLGN